MLSLLPVMTSARSRSGLCWVDSGQQSFQHFLRWSHRHKSKLYAYHLQQIITNVSRSRNRWFQVGRNGIKCFVPRTKFLIDSTSTKSTITSATVILATVSYCTPLFRKIKVCPCRSEMFAGPGFWPRSVEDDGVIFYKCSINKIAFRG